MAISPDALNAQKNSKRLDDWEKELDQALTDGKRDSILVQQMFDQSDAEEIASRFRRAGWNVSHRPTGGRSGGFVFSFSQ